MNILGITASDGEVAGAKRLVRRFFDIKYRKHDYDLGLISRPEAFLWPVTLLWAGSTIIPRR